MVSLIMVHKINGGLPKLNKTGQIITFAAVQSSFYLLKLMVINKGYPG